MNTHRRSTTKPRRSTHRPISIIAEDFIHLPMERETPKQTDIDVNIKMSREKARELIRFLEHDLKTMPQDIDWIIVTIKGVTP